MILRFGPYVTGHACDLPTIDEVVGDVRFCSAARRWEGVMLDHVRVWSKEREEMKKVEAPT